MGNIPEIFESYPAVYAVGKNYIITVPVKSRCYMWAKVGDKMYYDESNGTLRKLRLVHKVTVPMDELNEAKEYTLYFRNYSSDKDEPVVSEYTSSFRPVDPAKEKINVYHLADVHSSHVEAVSAAGYFESIGEDMDFLILNGDIFNDGNELWWFTMHHKVAGQITRGEIPVVHARGNHDTRGEYAEYFADYMPAENGNSYYTFRLGSIWGICLDAGEDKADDHEEYNYANIFDRFRENETKWLESIALAEKPEFLDEGIKYRIIVCHSPFSRRHRPPFNIDEDRFAYWCKLLRENVKPHVMMNGHYHTFYVSLPGDEYDAFDLACPSLVGGKAERIEGTKHYTGSAFTICGNKLQIRYTDEAREVKGKAEIQLGIDK